MEIAIIVAVALNGVIGRAGSMPWHLPADLKQFKRLTLGKPIVMGRRTWLSIGARPLPGRPNLVLTRSPAFTGEGCTVVRSIEEAIAAGRAAAPEARELMVIGGGEVYAAFLPLADRLYLTRIDAAIDGDTRFPALDPEAWREASREERPADERHPYALTFLVLERQRP